MSAMDTAFVFPRSAPLNNVILGSKANPYSRHSLEVVAGLPRLEGKTAAMTGTASDTGLVTDDTRGDARATRQVTP